MKHKPRKITIVSNYYPPHIGGLEVVAQKQAESLLKHGYEVSVVTTQLSGKKSSIINEGGITVYRISALNFFDTYFGIPFPISSFGLFARLYREIKDADVVHIHDVFYQISWVASSMAYFIKKPIFLTQHVGMVQHKSKLVMFIERVVYTLIGRRIFSMSKSIIVYNHNVKNFLREENVDMSKVIELRNGIDIAIFHQIDKSRKKDLRRIFDLPMDKPIVLFVGRFVPKKGFDELFKARDEKYEIVFAGSGSVPDSLRKASGVHFVGPFEYNKMAQLYQLADIFALPADGELFTLAMQEAMASGLPVITTNDPGYREYDVDRDAIAFIKPRALELKSTILRILNNEGLYKRMSAYSLALAHKWFDWNSNIKEIIGMYSRFHDNEQKIIVTTSWDDGHILDIKLADLLSRYGIKGTFYISPENHEFKKENLLNEEQIRQIGDNFEIGAHTITHPKLSELSSSDAKKEIDGSKKYLERTTGKRVASFCYPGGYYTKENVRQVVEAGFRLARTVRRFDLEFKDNQFELGTSVHTYDHWSDLWPILVFSKFNPFTFFRFYRRWDDLAIAMFDRCKQDGHRIFHLWGHSWEIEKHGDWSRLERVLAHISRRENVNYINNGELI